MAKNKAGIELPKATKIYVDYDLGDPDSLVAYRALEDAIKDAEDAEKDEKVFAVYELTGVVDVTETKKRVVKFYPK